MHISGAPVGADFNHAPGILPAPNRELIGEMLPQRGHLIRASIRGRTKAGNVLLAPAEGADLAPPYRQKDI